MSDKKNLNKLSEPNKARLYGCLCHLEKSLKDSYGHFDIEKESLKKFIDEKSLFMSSLCKRNEEKAQEYKNFLLVNSKKPEKFKDVAGNDLAYWYIKHIRNAIAHANVVSINRDKFEITDYSRTGKKTAWGKINCKVLFSLIEQLLDTKKNN